MEYFYFIKSERPILIKMLLNKDVKGSLEG